MIDPDAKKKAVNAFLAEQPYTIEDVQYGFDENTPLLASIYQPKNRPNKQMPAVVYIHGGGFTSGARDHFESTAAYLTNQGFVGVCISYRLAPKDKFPKQIQDCKCAIRWLKANANEWNVDPEKIVVCGSSAGGNLAALVAYASDNKEFEEKGGSTGFSDSVKGAILFCGIYDFAPNSLTENSQRKDRTDYLGGKYEEMPLVYQKASPIYYVSKNSPPTLLLHGDADTTVRIEQSYSLQNKLNSFGIPNELIIVEGGPHNAWDFLKPHCFIAMKQMEAFLLKLFKNDSF